MIRPLLISLALAAPAAAQNAFDMAKHFEMFDRYCRPAMQGLEPFKAAVSVPGPLGEPVFSVSPDGFVIDAYTGIEGFLVTAKFHFSDTDILRFCHIQDLTTVGTQLSVTEPAFLANAPKGEGIRMYGGQKLEEIPAVGTLAMAGLGNLKSPRATYNIYGAMDPPEAVITAYMGDNQFTLNAMVRVAR